MRPRRGRRLRVRGVSEEAVRRAVSSVWRELGAHARFQDIEQLLQEEFAEVFDALFRDRAPGARERLYRRLNPFDREPTTKKGRMERSARRARRLVPGIPYAVHFGDVIPAVHEDLTSGRPAQGVTASSGYIQFVEPTDPTNLYRLLVLDKSGNLVSSGEYFAPPQGVIPVPPPSDWTRVATWKWFERTLFFVVIAFVVWFVGLPWLIPRPFSAIELWTWLGGTLGLVVTFGVLMVASGKETKSRTMRESMAARELALAQRRSRDP